MGRKISNTWFTAGAERIMIDPEGRSFDLYACGSAETAFSVSASIIGSALSGGMVVKIGSISAPTTVEGIVPGTFFMIHNSLDVGSHDEVEVI